jgi:hypothetical protein
LIIFQSLKKYANKLANGKKEIDEEELYIRNHQNISSYVEWQPQLDALLRYGSWMTPKRRLHFGFGKIVGNPENFVQELLIHLANTR